MLHRLVQDLNRVVSLTMWLFFPFQGSIIVAVQRITGIRHPSSLYPCLMLLHIRLQSSPLVKKLTHSKRRSNNSIERSILTYLHRGPLSSNGRQTPHGDGSRPLWCATHNRQPEFFFNGIVGHIRADRYGWIDSWEQSTQLANYWRRHFNIPEEIPTHPDTRHRPEAGASPATGQESSM